MRWNFTLFFLLLITFISFSTIAQQPLQQFTNYAMGGPNSDEFTTNNFKAIAVGKGNVIWAGTQYGGLYMYNDSFNIWRKSDKLTNVFINDIKADADSGIWVAQSGTQSVGGNSNIGGGVNYFPVASDISMEFYSVAGTTTFGHIVSRNARSLYIDQSKTAANNDLPRPWVAQGTYLTSFNAQKGGLSVGLNPYWPYFTTINAGFVSGTNVTPIAEAIGGNSQEVWVYTRQNGTPATKLLRYKLDGSFIGDYSHLNVPVLTNGFMAQAIFFDSHGNKWAGLRDGGLRILTPNGWKFFNSIAFFPSGTQVNYNAMTEDEFGNVYIGTNNGLIEYKSPLYNAHSTPDTVIAYKLYTTADGLPSNNVQGLAYDKKNGNLLIATAGGVSFLKKREPFIKGVVFDVYAGIDSANNPMPGLQKKPLENVTVNLLKNDVVEETTTTNEAGIFELKEADDNEVYEVEVIYNTGKRYKYIYTDIRNHTLMEPVLIPDSLIKELNTFKGKMERRCFPITMSFAIQLNPEIFCVDAFNSAGFNLAIDPFHSLNGVTSDHKKRVDNLADYYAAMATVYKLGGDATELNVDAATNLLDGIEAFISLAEFGIKFKKPGNKIKLDDINESAEAFVVNSVKLMKEGLVYGLSKAASQLDKYPNAKKACERSVAVINEVADLMIESFENDNQHAALKFLVDNLKKMVAQYIAVDEYRAYATIQHKDFIANTSNAARNLGSAFTYEQTYDNLFNPSANSLAKVATDTFNSTKATIATLANVAKVADLSSTALDGAELLTLVPGGQIAGLVAKSLSLAAKATKMSALFSAFYFGARAANDISEMSDQVRPKAGLQRTKPLQQLSAMVSSSATDSLVSKKDSYHQAITELQAVYAMSAYDSILFGNKFKSFKNADSLFSDELTKTLHLLWSAADSANNGLPGFTGRLNTVIDSFVSTQAMLRNAMYLQNLGYIVTPDKPSFKPGLDSLCAEIKTTTDSAVNGLVQLLTDISNNNIPSIAYLVQEGYQLNHTKVPGTSGSVTYTFINRGSVPQTNVSFKINQPSGGYSINSSDSIFAGTIQPGQHFNVTYHFTAPAADSIGHYIIDVKADNGRVEDVTGAFYVIDPLKVYSVKSGNWDNPSTWSTEAVPTPANSVYIYHDVNVNVNATVLKATLSYPGIITVDPNKILTILE